MSFWTVTKVGTIFSSGHQYFPTAIATDDLVGWPWTVTCFTSSDHLDIGIYMSGAVGDPSVPGNWETYDAAVARGAFDAFATKPAGNPVIAGKETPHITKVGTQFILTCHANELSHNNEQQTVAFVADDFPLNFSLLANGNNGIVLDSYDGSLQEWPHSQSMHTGYMRHAANPFDGVTGNYFGVSLFGGGDFSRAAMYTSNDALSWSLHALRESTPGLPGIPPGFELPWNELDIQSIRSIGNGEYVGLCTITTPASGTDPRTTDTYELTFSRDAMHVTRQAILVLPRSASGNDQIGAAHSSIVEVGGQTICIYQGRRVGNDSSLMLATATFNAAATKAAPLKHPNFTSQRFDAVGETALPAWLEAEGSVTVDATHGIQLSAASGIRTTDTITPDNETWVEWYVEQGYLSSKLLAQPLLYIGDTGPGEPTNGLGAISYNSIADTQLRTRLSGSNAATQLAGNSWYSNSYRRHRHGLRWRVSDNELDFIGHSRDLIKTWAVSTAPKASPLRPRFGAAENSIYVTAVELRKGVTSGGVEPTITAVTRTSETVATVTLSTACLGDPTGLTLYEDDVAVEGTWSRTTLTNAIFTRTAGTFVASPSLEVLVANTDLRSSDELVAPLNNAPAGVPTLYLAIYLAADPAPTFDRATGWSGSPVYTDLDASPVTTQAGYLFTPDVAGLASGTAYKSYAVWDDGTVTSNIVASSSWDTQAVVVNATAAGTLSAASLFAPTAAATGSATASGALSAASLTAPTGTATGGAVVNATATGSIAAVTTTAPTGSASAGIVISATATGEIIGIRLDAPAGSATATSNATASGAIAALMLTAPTGSAVGTQIEDATATGAIAPITLTAPTGFAYEGVLIDPALMRSLFARMDYLDHYARADHNDAYVRIESSTTP